MSDPRQRGDGGTPSTRKKRLGPTPHNYKRSHPPPTTVSRVMSFQLDDDDDDTLLANHLDELEQGFDFLLTPHLDRRVRRLGIPHRNYVGRLMQRGGAAPLPSVTKDRSYCDKWKKPFNAPYENKSSTIQTSVVTIIFSSTSILID